MSQQQRIVKEHLGMALILQKERIAFPSLVPQQQTSSFGEAQEAICRSPSIGTRG
jgi:hypothetical protein